jgi:hypothetical protein
MAGFYFQKLLTRTPARFKSVDVRPESKAEMTLRWEIEDYTRVAGANHGCGSLPLETLLRVEQLLDRPIEASAETGCGKSTIFFSRKSKRHKVFCLDDRTEGAGSSVRYFLQCPATCVENLDIIYGPTQLTLPGFTDHPPYDLVLIDGPHGYPFPEIEYFYFYPHLSAGGLLVIDDVHIPTIGRLAEFISEDRMFNLIEFIGTTAIFRRTDAPVFDPYGDGWWRQDYNRRRAYFAPEFYLRDDARRRPLSFDRKFKARKLVTDNSLINRLRMFFFIKRLDWGDVVSARSTVPVSTKQIDFQRNLQKIIQMSEFFDEKFYLENNPDIENSGWSAALHYLLEGGFEGRDPGPKFSTRLYLEKNPDAAAMGLNALLHHEISKLNKKPLL